MFLLSTTKMQRYFTSIEYLSRYITHLCLLSLFCYQLARLSELEEMVTEQDNALAVAAEKYKKSRNEISKMKKDHEEQVNSLKQQLAR